VPDHVRSGFVHIDAGLFEQTFKVFEWSRCVFRDFQYGRVFDVYLFGQFERFLVDHFDEIEIGVFLFQMNRALDLPFFYQFAYVIDAQLSRLIDAHACAEHDAEHDRAPDESTIVNVVAVQVFYFSFDTIDDGIDDLFENQILFLVFDIFQLLVARQHDKFWYFVLVQTHRVRVEINRELKCFFGDRSQFEHPPTQFLPIYQRFLTEY
jgi:hypothetical protein